MTLAKRRFMIGLAAVMMSMMATLLPVRSAQAADVPGLTKLEKDLRNAVALLYGQDEGGSLRMLCTATAFERDAKDRKLYRFVTAAHCVADDDTVHERVEVSPANWFITFDDQDNKNFFSAKLVAVGYQHNGHDFAVLETRLDMDIVTIPVAKSDPLMGESVVNIASPLGLGKQMFRGHVSMNRLDRPLVQDSINWKGATFLQMSVGPGSSGSAIVSYSRGSIIAILVGSIGSPFVVSIPIGKFSQFWNDVRTGKYRWYKSDNVKEGAKPKGPSVKTLFERVRRERIFTIAPEPETPPASPSKK